MFGRFGAAGGSYQAFPSYKKQKVSAGDFGIRCSGVSEQRTTLCFHGKIEYVLNSPNKGIFPGSNDLTNDEVDNHFHQNNRANQNL
ncbi:hypothetical protein DSO57_1033682 [Entomophthora muscae]|uniref:Uncharacterized protein n=1 Tax=Entomophthora muscae TaxID=34485 RepID=A0ACC2TBZ3_9FUNG|nr:hypothetical protein DSO57_1033682 [Entomophthora muscae]